MFRFFNKNTLATLHKREKQSGFTLVEFLVVLGIMGLMLTVLVRGQKNYTETIALTNLADQMSLMLRQAQSYGIAVRESTPGSADFSSAYGLSVSLLGSGSPIAYIYFADKNRNGSYDNDWTCPAGLGSECMEKILMTQGNVIQRICLILNGGVENCNLPKRVDISYVRPRTEAKIVAYNPGGEVINDPNIQGIKVELVSSSGRKRFVAVYKMGQISVGEPSP